MEITMNQYRNKVKYGYNKNTPYIFIVTILIYSIIFVSQSHASPSSASVSKLKEHIIKIRNELKKNNKQRSELIALRIKSEQEYMHRSKNRQIRLTQLKQECIRWKTKFKQSAKKTYSEIQNETSEIQNERSLIRRSIDEYNQKLSLYKQKVAQYNNVRNSQKNNLKHHITSFKQLVASHNVQIRSFNAQVNSWKSTCVNKKVSRSVYIWCKREMNNLSSFRQNINMSKYTIKAKRTYIEQLMQNIKYLNNTSRSNLSAESHSLSTQKAFIDRRKKMLLPKLTSLKEKKLQLQLLVSRFKITENEICKKPFVALIEEQKKDKQQITIGFALLNQKIMLLQNQFLLNKNKLFSTIAELIKMTNLKPINSRTPNSASIFYKIKNSSIILPSDIHDKINLIGKEYFEKTRKMLTITSGNRTAKQQAEAMYPNLKAGTLQKYSNKQALKEIQDHYNMTLKNKPNMTEKEIISELTQIIQYQINLDIYISKHLRRGALDIRSKDMSDEDKKIFIDILKKHKVAYYDETNTQRPHYHLNF